MASGGRVENSNEGILGCGHVAEERDREAECEEKMMGLL